MNKEDNEKRKKLEIELGEKGTEAWLPIGLALGMSIGMALGSVLGNIVIGMLCGTMLGMCFGLAVGSTTEKKAKEDKDKAEK